MVFWPSVNACPDLHNAHRLLRDVGSPALDLVHESKVPRCGCRSSWRSSRGPGGARLVYTGLLLLGGQGAVFGQRQVSSHTTCSPGWFPFLPRLPVNNGVNQKRRVASTSSRRHPGMFQRRRGLGSSASPEPGLYFRAAPWAAFTVAGASGLPPSTEPHISTSPRPLYQQLTGGGGLSWGQGAFKSSWGSIRAERVVIPGSAYPNHSASLRYF